MIGLCIWRVMIQLMEDTHGWSMVTESIHIMMTIVTRGVQCTITASGAGRALAKMVFISLAILIRIRRAGVITRLIAP